jgi:HAD superfamily hydrolase (TIGR01549 family)
MIKLIIFDKDGTLIDHDKLFIPWLNELIQNLEPLLPKNHKLNEHLGFINNKFLYNSIIPCGTDKDIKNEIKKYTNIDDNVLNNIWKSTNFNYDNLKTHGDLIEIFNKLKKMNIKIAICTSDNRKETEIMINKTNIYKYIDYYVCGDDEGKSKPSGDPIRKICNYLNIKPNESIMVGDTITDIKAGKDAGCLKVISVLTGGYTKQELQDADIIIPDISYIFNYF